MMAGNLCVKAVEETQIFNEKMRFVTALQSFGHNRINGINFLLVGETIN